MSRHENWPDFYWTKIDLIFSAQKVIPQLIQVTGLIGFQIILTIEGKVTSLVSKMSTNGTDAVVPQSFRLAVQELINDCGRHLNLSSVHISAILVDALLTESAKEYIKYCWRRD